MKPKLYAVRHVGPGSCGKVSFYVRNPRDRLNSMNVYLRPDGHHPVPGTMAVLPFCRFYGFPVFQIDGLKRIKKD